jgi:hypothetical protein
MAVLAVLDHTRILTIMGTLPFETGPVGSARYRTLRSDR